MNKLSILFCLGLLSLALTMPYEVNAQGNNFRNEIKKDVRENIKAKITEMKEKKEEIRTTIGALRNKIANLIDAKVESVSGSTVTVSKDGKNYTVKTDGRTRYTRHYWGRSSLAEISVGNNLNIWGVWTDDTGSNITARMIRNTSVMKRFGVFMGSIKSKDTSGFVLATPNRNDQTVTIAPNTKYINRRGTAIAFSDLNVGDRIRVRGLWDKTNNTISEVSQIKDFSLPVIPTPTVKP